MTYNVRHGLAADKENRWELRKDVVVRSIRRKDPDFVGGQEFYRFQTEFLAREFPAFDWYGMPRSNGLPSTGGMDETCPVFYRSQRFLPLSLGTFWLSKTPDEFGSNAWDAAIPRICSYGEFFDRETERTVWLFNTHFDHRGPEARLESARLIARRAEKLAETGDAILIIGDFNARGGKSDPWNALIEAGFRDAWAEALETSGPATTWGRFQPPEENDDRRIDWILFKGPLKPLYAETVTYNEEGRYPSDHYPVFARFRWAAE